MRDIPQRYGGRVHRLPKYVCRDSIQFLLVTPSALFRRIDKVRQPVAAFTVDLTPESPRHVADEPHSASVTSRNNGSLPCPYGAAIKV